MPVPLDILAQGIVMPQPTISKLKLFAYICGVELHSPTVRLYSEVTGVSNSHWPEATRLVVDHQTEATSLCVLLRPVGHEALFLWWELRPQRFMPAK